MKGFSSMSDFADYLSDKARISRTYGKYMASYVSAFTMIMKTCKGRDKICSMIQYLADLYYYCNKYSQFDKVKLQFSLGRNHGAIIAWKLRQNMKNSRKIFKFLKFIDHIASIVKNIESKKPLYLRLLSILQSLMAFFANLFDNVLWLINIEVIDKLFKRDKTVKKIKANKYFFSLCKIILKMLSNNFKHHTRIKQMKQIIVKLRSHRQNNISFHNGTYDLCKDYLKHRQEVRIQEIDGAIMLCRIVMLVRKLELPGYTFVTKILYSVCGLVSTCLSLFKMVIDQPILLQLQQKKQVPKNYKIQQEQFQSFKQPARIKFNRSGTIDFSNR